MKNIFRYKTSFSQLSVFFLLSFCCYFMTAIMSISPIYFSTFIGIIFLFLQLYYKNIPYASIFVYGSCIFYSLWYLIDCIILDTKIHQALVSSFFALYYIFIDIALYQINDKKKINKLIKFSYFIFLTYYLFDLALRYRTMQTLEVPEWMKVNPILKFYLLKQGGFTGDSNTMGVFCTVFFSVTFFSFLNKIFTKKYVILAFILTVFTCSRAAIVSCLALLLFWYFFYITKTSTKCLLLILGIILISAVFIIFLKDASFLTKLDIFQKTIEYIKKCDISTFLVGLGPNNSKLALGRYAHNIWSIMLIEYGFVGLVLFFSMMLLLMASTGKYFFIVAIPYFLISLSFTPIFLQFLFCGFSIVKHISRIYPLISHPRIIKHKKHYFLKYQLA